MSYREEFLYETAMWRDRGEMHRRSHLVIDRNSEMVTFQILFFWILEAKL